MTKTMSTNDKIRAGLELMKAVDTLQREKGIPQDVVFTAIERAVRLAVGKFFGDEDDVDVQIEALSQHRVDVAMTYLMNEPVQLHQLGYQVETLNASDYLNLISVGVATSDRNIGASKSTLSFLQNQIAAWNAKGS